MIDDLNQLLARQARVARADADSLCAGSPASRAARELSAEASRGRDFVVVSTLVVGGAVLAAALLGWL